MKPLGLSANALALALRVPATWIGDILRPEKQRAVTADAAIRLARYFGTTRNSGLTRSRRRRVALATSGVPIHLAEAGIRPYMGWMLKLQL
jgi:hypothetical protein